MKGRTKTAGANTAGTNVFAVSLLRTCFTDVRSAARNLRAQAIRTLLTALGIIFGVGSVIGMLAMERARGKSRCG